MTQTKITNKAEPLEVFVKYSVLPASQAAVMLLILHELYEELYELVFDTGYEPDSKTLLHFRARDRHSVSYSAKNSLCIEQAQTGNSITIRLVGRGKSGRVRWNGSDFEISIPPWIATALGVGVLITGSGLIYQHYMEAQLKNAQMEGQFATNRLIEAQIQKTKAETDEIASRMHTPQPKPHWRDRSYGRTRRQTKIEENILHFRAIACQDNIVSIQINGVPVASAVNGNATSDPHGKP